jgi:hypothetical protein
MIVWFDGVMVDNRKDSPKSLIQVFNQHDNTHGCVFAQFSGSVLLTSECLRSAINMKLIAAAVFVYRAESLIDSLLNSKNTYSSPTVRVLLHTCIQLSETLSTLAR